MSLDPDVLFAILALDSYSRGYAPGLVGMPEDQLGGATILFDSSVLGTSSNGVRIDEASGFYAVAYSLPDGRIVISYRGTDNPSFASGGDFLNGWVGGGGMFTSQAALAFKFYQAVAAHVAPGVDLRDVNITTTGHSLGGGLAGLVAGIYNRPAVMFDNMPYEEAMRNAHDLAVLGSIVGLSNVIYGDAEPWDWSLTGIRGYAFTGEPLGYLRFAQERQPVTLSDFGAEFGGIAEGGNSNGTVARHMIGLLGIRLYGTRQWEGVDQKGTDWQAAAKSMLPALFETDIAKALGRSKETGSAPFEMQVANSILYSAIEAGLKPFGDVAIRALFDDTSDLGKALLAPNASSSIVRASRAIAEVFVQYAGSLALGHELADADLLRGIVENNGSVLSIDFNQGLWEKGQASSVIVGREALVASGLASLAVERDWLGMSTGVIRSDLVAGLNWFKQNNGIAVATPGELIDRVSFQIANQAFVGNVPDRPGGASSDRLSLFVSGDSADIITGSAANDFIYSGKGDDKLIGGAGDDVLAGGDDKDIFIGGGGRDFLAGGSGEDTIELSVDGSAGVTIHLKAIDAAAADERATFEIIFQGETDRAIDMEHIRLTEHDDIVRVDYLGDPNGWEAPMGALSVDFLGAPLALGVDMLDLSAAGRPGGITGPLGTGDVGVYVNLKDPTHQTVQYYYTWNIPLVGDVHTTGYKVRLNASGANSVKGTSVDDYLVGTGGERGSGEGYSTLYGGNGNDTLVGAGWETHMFGGAGNDTFKAGANSWIEDAETGDRITYGGITIFGGTKQWWMEGNTAYWAPFSTVMTAFPVIGAELLYTASFFIDVMTMKFATFQLQADGTMKMLLGWGHGGGAAIKDYHLNLDTGAASAGVVVFETGRAGTTARGEGALTNISKFVNLALKAGFGVGLPGFDPLVLDLDGDGYELTTEGNSDTYFEFDSDGFGERTGWVRGDDGFLVRDGNGNGLIDNVTEMFGNRTTPGFAVLSGYDLNADGAIDSADAVYADLRVWQDRDQDGVTDAGEIRTLSELGIVSISLAATEPAEPTLIGGNRLLDSGHFTRADGTVGNLADFALDINETATRWLGDNSVSAAAAALPQLAGFGEVKDLRVAMTGDSALQSLVESFAAATTNDLPTLKADAEAILYEWAGVDSVAATAIGTNGFDARKLAFLEAYSGYQLMPRDSGGALVLTNLAEMEALWGDQVTRLTLRLVIQGPMADAFDGISYRADLDLLVADTPTALEDLYRGLLEDLPSDSAAALAQWQSWAPLLGAMADGMRRFDANLVRDDYVAAQLVAAMDGLVQPLSFAQLAGALGIENLRLGTAGDDALTRAGASGAAIFVTEGGGTDILTGGSGQDVYIFGRTIGNATINDIEAKPAGDRIRFTFLTPDDVTIRRDGYDLLITVKATGETVRVTGQFADVVPMGSDVLLSSNKGIEDIQFADGTIYEIPEIMTAVGTGTDGNDHIVGTMHSDVLIGGKGDDRLQGGDDADLYVIHAGDGHDIIAEHQSTVLLRAADLLIFGDNIAPQHLAFSRTGSGGDDLLITIGATSQTVRIEGQFGYTSLGYNHMWSPNSRIESFAFKEYGESFGLKDLQQRLIADATTAGNDIARGFGDDDEFAASAGNDLLIGMDGIDVYNWGSGSGNDVIDEDARYIGTNVGLGGISLVEGNDTVKFGSGIVQSALVFSRSSSAPDLLITLVATGETLTVKNQFAGFQTGPLGAQWFDRVEWFQFADGTRISWQQVLLDITTGTPGNDSLWGDLYIDVMDGGEGDDVLSGLGLADTYVFKLGYGHDTLVDNNQSILGSGFITLDTTPDVLRFGPGIAPADISFERNGKDLTLVVGTGGDRVTLQGQDDYFHTGVFGAISYDRIEEIRFDDGTVWTWQQLNARVIALATTPGDDVARGFMMADRFEASPGDDIMIGGDSADTYVFGPGSGHDIVREDVSNVLYGDDDVVEFAAGVLPGDVGVARNGEDLVLTLVATGDTLTVDGEFRYSNWFEWWDIERFRFADGTVWTKHDIQVRLLQSTSGNDHLVGFMTGDSIDGGAGDDLLEGGDGSDSYHFGLGSGHDEIRETVSNANLGDNDRLVFGAGILPSDVGFVRDGDALVVTLLATGDTLRIDGQFAFSNWFAWWDVERFEFADGTVLTDRDVANKIMGGTPGNDHIVGTFRSDTLDGGAGNDLLEGGDGADRYVFGRGYGQDEIRETLSNANLSEDDQLQFLPGVTLADLGFQRSGNDLIITILGTTDKLKITGEFSYSNWYTWWDIDRFVFDDGTILSKVDVQQMLIAPTAGNDHIVGFMTGDLIDGGAGNDILEGGDGSDTYKFGLGSGQDVIRETVSNANLSDNDRLVFGVGILPSDVAFARDGDALVVTLVPTGETLRIDGQFKFSNWFSWWDVESFEFADGTVLTDRDVANKIMGGTPGNDHIVGTFRSDTLDGGAGNDLLEGGDGADRYVFGRGYGQDEIRETLSNANLSEDDQLQFLPGVTLADLGFQRSGNDLIITILGTTDKLKITGEFSYSNWYTWWDIDRFVFDDGTIVTKVDIQQMLLTGTSGADHIVGFMTGDLIDGGAGNDILQGEDGGDTYVFGRGSGQDEIRETMHNANLSENDTLRFGADVQWSDLRFSRSGDALTIAIAGTSDSIRIDGQFSTINDTSTATWWDVENFVFVDGTTRNIADIMAEMVKGTAGDDILVGYYGADTFNGGAGNDRMEGGRGADTYVHNVGDGNDIVSDYVYYWGSGGDRILFGAGIAPADVAVRRSSTRPGDMVLVVRGGESSVTLTNQITGGREWTIDTVQFADGTVWTAEQLANFMTTGAATNGDDMIDGTTLADEINGGGGNDLIRGGGGNDRLDGGAGNDRLEGSAGNDVYLYAAGGGNDVVYDYVDYWGSTDRLEFGPGIAIADLVITRSATDWNDMVISFATVAGSVVLDNQFAARDWGIDTIGFADGTSLGAIALNDIFFGQSRTAGNDLIEGGYLNDVILGLAGNDILRGHGGNDRLEGGEGDDRLEGGGGDDIYVYAAGGGNDFIAEYVDYWGSWDVVQLGSGIVAADLVLNRGAADSNDLVISFAGAPGSITVDNYWVARDWGIDELRFANGTVLSAAAINALYFAAKATAGNETITGGYYNEAINGLGGDDILRGGGGNDTLDGGTGNDRLEGSAGDDVYVYAPGGGDDVLYDYVDYWGSWNVLRFAAGIAPADLRFTAYAADLSDMVITFASAPGSVRIDNQILSGREFDIDQVQFADGTVWSLATLLAEYAARQGSAAGELIGGTNNGETLNGLGGNDTIRAFSGNDILIGGLGNDQLEGGAGLDIYRYAPGEGDDVIFDQGGTRDNRLVFGAGIAPGDVMFSRPSNDTTDLRITFKSMSGSIVIDHETWSDAGIEFIEFADGTVLSGASLAARIGPGSGLADTIAGTAGNDEIWALEGNDWVQGLGGDDILRGDSGIDVLAGGDGNDALLGGDGNDLLIGDARAQAGSNLVVNGSFEQTGGTVANQSWGVTATAMPGWNKANASVYELTNGGWGGITATDARWLELDGAGSGSNMDISQLIGGRTAGELLTLTFDAAYRTSIATCSFEVLWNGVVVATIAPSTTTMSAYSLTLAAVAGDNLLGFRSIGAADAVGAALDNVRLHATVAGTAGDDVLTGGAGDDRIDGGAGSDTAIFAGNVADYTIGGWGDRLTVTDLDPAADGHDGSDRLSGIEHLQFKDGTIAAPSAPANSAPSGLTLYGPTFPILTDFAGQAGLVGSNNYWLTRSLAQQSGAVWGDVDLSKDVVWNARLYFGADAGSDGIGFALQNGSASPLGTSYGALTAGSIGIRFDTHVNPGDPASDFSQFVLNGQPSTSFDPYHLHLNVENSAWHDVVIDWSAATQTLGYWLDGTRIASKVVDVGALFAGDPTVRFGFGASTGAVGNHQQLQIMSMVKAVDQLEVAENAVGGTLVGRFAGVDPDGDALSYTLTDSGGAPLASSLFEIVGNELRIKAGASVDYETASSHSLNVKVADAAGGVLIVPVTVAVRNLVDGNEAPSGLSLFVDSARPTALAGSATQTATDTFRLTPNTASQSGAVWGEVDLSANAVWKTRMYFGGADGGAEGISFAFQNGGTAALGGYGALTAASFGIRFDTYANAPLGDPASDFSQFVRNNSTGATSTQFDWYRNHSNLETNSWRDVVISWDAASKTLSYTLDGIAVGSKSYDVVTELFGGDSSVLYGFGAATGGAYNEHRVQILSVQYGVSGFEVTENALGGTLIGRLQGQDSNAGDALSYALVDAGGSAVADSLFEIVNGNELRVKAGATIDYESETSHDLRVRISDSSGASTVATVEIDIVDVYEGGGQGSAFSSGDDWHSDVRTARHYDLPVLNEWP